jgi:hypothetical protein
VEQPEKDKDQPRNWSEVDIDEQEFIDSMLEWGAYVDLDHHFEPPTETTP